MKESNTLLKHAVDEIVRGINNDKLEPQAAVVKVAKELDLNVNFIKRACEVVNVALTYNHFKKHADARDQDFPIVDAANVTKEIFGNKEKTAAELKAEWFPSQDFDVESINYGRILTDPQYKKAYVQIVSSPEKHDKFITSVRGIFEKSAAYLEKLEKERDELHIQKIGKSQDYSAKFAALIEKFGRDVAYRTPFGEFESQVYSMYGEDSTPFVDLVYKTAGLTEDRGVHDSKYQLFDTCKEAEMLQDFMSAVKDFQELSKQAADAEHNYKFEKDFITSAYQKMAEATNVETPVQTQIVSTTAATPAKAKGDGDNDEDDKQVDPVMEEVNKKTAHVSFAEKTAADLVEAQDDSSLSPAQKNLPPALKAAIIRSKKKYAEFVPVKQAGVMDGVDFIKNHASGIGSPSHPTIPNSSAKNTDRKLLLQELMVADPILSTMEPHRVAGLYEQWARLAPELSMEKEITRGALRQMGSAQALEPHSAQQFIDTNTALLKQRMIQEGKLPVKA